MEFKKACLLLILCCAKVFAGGYKSIQRISGYYLITKMNNISRDTTFELWSVDLAIKLSIDTVKYAQIVKTNLIKGGDSSFILKGNTVQYCYDHEETCRIELKNDCIEIEFDQQRVTKLFFKVTGDLALQTFDGVELHGKFNQGDKLKITLHGERINKDIRLSIMK